MTGWPYRHWPYIVAAYGLALAVLIGFSLAAWLRLRRARRQLAAIDPRARHDESPA